jgi:serine/threonine protein kinase
MQEGGRLLGQGIYGCAFDPPLICKDGRKMDANKVGKITSKDEADNEMGVSRAIRNVIPNATKYYILVEDSCIVAPRSKQKEKELSSCNAISGVKIPTMTQITMPFGGKPLRIVPKTIQFEFFNFAKHLLEGSALLVANGIVHGDLHTMNILIDTPSTGKFIDFGLAWNHLSLTLANVSILDRVFNPAINQEPPEVSTLNGYLDNIPFETILARISDEKVGIILLSKVYAIPVDTLMNQLKTFIRESWSLKNKNRYSFYKLYWSKIDCWGIGMMLLSVFIEMTMDDRFETTPAYLEKSDQLLEICKEMCRMDPALRMDAAEALEIYAPESDVLREPAVMSWLQLQKEQREQLGKIAL